MIEIIIDIHHKLKDDSNAIIVNNEKDYVESRLRIKEAYQKRRNIKVVIRNKKFKEWYKSLLDYDYTTKKEISPKSILAKRLKISPLLIPFNDEEVERLKLIEKVESSPPSHILTSNNEVKSWVLSVSINRCFGEEGGTFEHIAKFASYFLGRNRNTDTESLLKDLVEQKVNEWQDTSLGSVYKSLLEAPEDNAFFLYAMQLTKNYEESIQKSVIREINKDLKELDSTIDLDRVPLIVCDDDLRKREFSDVLEIKWKNVLRDRFQYKKSEIKDKHELEKRFEKILIKAIEQMSGKIIGELNGLTSFIKGNAQYFNESLFGVICAKFSVFSEKMKELKEIISPEFPTKPSEDWSWKEVCEWVKGEYLPYKKWAIRQGLIEGKELKEYSKMYSNWLYENYPKMKNDVYPLNYGTWYVIKDYIEEDYQVLWIVMDNLCWFLLEDIIDAFQREDFNLHPPGIVPRLSMLPSETKVSKCALVAGKLSSQIDEDTMYKDLFESFCKANNIRTYSFIEGKDLKNDELGKDMVTCCIINKLDFSSHRADFDLDDELKDSIKRCVKYIKAYISSGIENNNLSRDKIIVIVSTDHGSCSLPKDSKGYNKPEGAEINNKHKRFVCLNRTESLNDNWFYLEKDSFGLRENIAIIKGYDFIGKRKPRGLVHGGLTPEETFIPHLEFCLSPIEIKCIECIHTSNPIPLGTIKREVEIAIRNPNEYEIKNVKIFLPARDIDINVKRISPKDETEKSFEMSLPKETITLDEGSIATLKGYYRFDCLGIEKHGELKIKIKVRRILDRSGTAEDFFDFGG